MVLRQNMIKIGQWFLGRSTGCDVSFLSLFTVFITWNPYYLHQTVNLFELGLYLPGISAVLQGQIPYRDFFYLRGPFELYMPAFFMHLFGEHVAVLSTYFYVGTVLALVVCIFIAYRLYPSRIFLYTMIPVLVARTFPRVVFTYWGGMRYAWGLLAVLCGVCFFMNHQRRWLFFSGMLTAIGGLTSVEIGVSAFVAVVMTVSFAPNRWRLLSAYAAGICSTLAPYLVYLTCHNGLSDYLNAQWVVTTRITKTFLQTETVPATFMQFLSALFIPENENFHQMTPVYCYLIFVLYLLWRHRHQRLDGIDKSAAVVAVYGAMVYVTGFRNLWANVFEMSLQPEKIVLFYLLARLSMIAFEKQHFRKMACALLFILAVSSWGYSGQRFSKRFLFFRKDPLKDQSTAVVNLPRIKGMVVPQGQAQDFIRLKEFVDAYTALGEVVLMYPELGALHFILDRPWVGKFPTATLAWLDEGWYEQYMRELVQAHPRYAIVNKQAPASFEKAYFPVARNREKYQAQMAYITDHYSMIGSTPMYNIYSRNY